MAGLEVETVQWDLGVQGVGLLLVMAVVFGLAVQLVWGRAGWPWLWPAAAVAGFGSGILISEVWFGWATEEELQPNIDGVSYDETLLALLLTALAVLVVRLVRRRTRQPWIGPDRAGHRRRSAGSGPRRPG